MMMPSTTRICAVYNHLSGALTNCTVLLCVVFCRPGAPIVLVGIVNPAGAEAGDGTGGVPTGGTPIEGGAPTGGLGLNEGGTAGGAEFGLLPSGGPNGGVLLTVRSLA